MRTLLGAVLIWTFASATVYGQVQPEAADDIYLGGDILTMNPAQPLAEALAVKDGKIIAVGKDAELKRYYKHGTTRSVDLQGKALLPGFLDAHSHYVHTLSVPNQLNLYPPPAGSGKDVPTIIQALSRFQKERSIPPGEVIQAYGYDDTVMPAGRLLNRGDLDQALPDNPVVVLHVSMHGAVLNSAALKKWGIVAETETPPGGIIVRKPGSNEPWGLLMETAFLPIFAQLPKPDRDEQLRLTREAQLLYAAEGITTVHDGATHAHELEIMQRAAGAGANLLDVIVYPFITELDAVLQDNPIADWGKYRNRLKIGGVKITVDGSPQGRTAYFTEPYLTGGPGGEEDWRGELTFEQDTVNQMVKRVYDLGVPLNLHANGDAAIDAFLQAHGFAAGEAPGKDRDVTLIHSQFVRPDQLEKYAEYNVTPSLYTLHTYYFAEAHKKNRGAEQAAYISPMRDAIDLGLAPTNHTDYIVAPLDQMFMLWSAVNRVSRGGATFGAEQRVTAAEGLAAMTINVARQYNEEHLKGSLEPGKLADLVILDKNPLSVEPMAIRNIAVVATIKEGTTVYEAP
ncbi:MAG: amidohydrolase [Halioglobus sp.]